MTYTNSCRPPDAVCHQVHDQPAAGSSLGGPEPHGGRVAWSCARVARTRSASGAVVRACARAFTYVRARARVRSGARSLMVSCPRLCARSRILDINLIII